MKSEIERIDMVNSAMGIIISIFILTLMIGLIFKDTFIILVVGVVTMLCILSLVVYVLLEGD